jgi:hypothetical protein
MAFVFASTSAIDELFKQRARNAQTEAQRTNFSQNKHAPIRRPHRGIQIKEDTYATMSIVDGRGNPVKLISESAVDWPEENKGRVNTYADFIIQQISEERTEKSQILETFGDSFVFFFGERPRMLSISGLLMNTDDFGWRSQFMENYNEYLRGSKLVQRNARLYLAWDTIVVEGYPINLSASEDSNNPYSVNFQMQIFLTNYNDFGRLGITDFPPASRDTETFEALNRELEERDRYISTTAAVRRKTFESRDGSSGLGGFLREGIRGINTITNIASGLISSASTLLSGRVVRTPLGIAGFLAQVNDPGVAAVGVTEGFLASMDFAGFTDTKLTVPRRPQYAAVDEMILRTQIGRNFDEYPQISDLDGLPTRWSLLERLKFEERRAARELKKVERQAEAVVAAEIAGAEAEALDAFQDVVSFAKTGFALFNTTKAVLEDPGGVALDAMGLSGIA